MAGAYVLLSGEVAVRRGDEEIGRLLPSDLIGEIAWVRAIMHTATVLAIGDVEALHLTLPVAQGLRRTMPEFRTASNGPRWTVWRATCERAGPSPGQALA